MPAALPAAWKPPRMRRSPHCTAPARARHYHRHAHIWHEEFMGARTSLHAEALLRHHPHPFHAIGASPRPVIPPRACVPWGVPLAPNRRRAVFMHASCSSLRSFNGHWSVGSASAGCWFAARPVKGAPVARAFGAPLLLFAQKQRFGRTVATTRRDLLYIHTTVNTGYTVRVYKSRAHVARRGDKKL